MVRSLIRPAILAGLAGLAGLVAACGGDSILDSYDFQQGRVSFTHLPIDRSGVHSFVPMGEPNVVPKDHGGFPSAR